MANKTNRETGETAAKILLYDVESSPNLAWIWNKYEQNAVGDFIRERQIISFAWKWLGSKEIQCFALPMIPGYKTPKNYESFDNKKLIERLHSLMVEADIVVGHNVDAFDDPMSNSEFLAHGLKPPPPHKTVDTLKFARHKFRFNSNRLDDLGQKLGLGRKAHTGGFPLWVGCMNGDKKSWEKMIAYNKKDVLLLEKIYLKMRPFMSQHPQLNVMRGDVCIYCLSKKVQFRGTRIHLGQRYPRFQCMNPVCGKWMTGKAKDGAWKFK